MDKSNKFIVVTGATGQQGGAATRHLLSEGWKVRALTRDVNKPAAQALVQAGAELFKADNEDRAALEAAFKGAYGVFSIQNFWMPNVGAEGEVRQGKTIAKAAKAAGVEHLVYSSVGAAHRGMGQAHFATKFEIENYVKSLGVPYTILRPVLFMDNLNRARPQITNGTYMGMTLPPGKTKQMIAVDDIGGFAALAFDNPGRYLGETIELAGDELTETQIADTLSNVIGRPVKLTTNPAPTGNRTSEEMAAMTRFFNGPAYEADIPVLRKTYPPLKTLEQWLRSTGWENAEPMPIPEAAGWGR